MRTCLLLTCLMLMQATLLTGMSEENQRDANKVGDKRFNPTIRVNGPRGAVELYKRFRSLQDRWSKEDKGEQTDTGVFLHATRELLKEALNDPERTKNISMQKKLEIQAAIKNSEAVGEGTIPVGFKLHAEKP